MSDKVSIIIPVYNGEKYLSECIASALSQTYGNIEVIVVNDGSKDGSAEIAKAMQSGDDRLKVVDQVNGGVSAARKTGLEHASGEWICFLDADDTLPARAIEEYSKQFSEGADIIVSGWSGNLSKEEYLTGILRLSIRPELWGKLFRAELLKDKIPALDRSIVMGEDMMQNLVIGLGSSKIVTIPELLYAINAHNPQSVTKTFKHSFEYERRYFALLDELFLKQCEQLSCFSHIKECVFWSKLNGLKQVVLDGGHFDEKSDLWSDIKAFYSSGAQGIGPSERLLLRMSGAQWLYRAIMTLRLKLCS